eukprot:3669267-Prymnesium_polylepis.1
MNINVNKNTGVPSAIVNRVRREVARQVLRQARKLQLPRDEVTLGPPTMADPREAAEMALNSTFCLCPTGDSKGFTARFYMALLHGCLPVRIDGYQRNMTIGPPVYPFPHLIDWRWAARAHLCSSLAASCMVLGPHATCPCFVGRSPQTLSRRSAPPRERQYSGRRRALLANRQPAGAAARHTATARGARAALPAPCVTLAADGHVQSRAPRRAGGCTARAALALAQSRGARASDRPSSIGDRPTDRHWQHQQEGRRDGSIGVSHNRGRCSRASRVPSNVCSCRESESVTAYDYRES